MLSIQNVNEQIKIYENKNIINNIIKKIDLIYKQINSKIEVNNPNIKNSNNEHPDINTNNDNNIYNIHDANSSIRNNNNPNVLDLLNNKNLIMPEKKPNKYNNYL